MSDATITFVVLGAAVVLFVANRVPVGVVALGAALALYAAGVISVDEAFSGFSDQTVVFIASLFVVSEALDATGVTSWAGQRLIAATGGRRNRLVVALLGFAALLTALVTPNASVAALLPMAAVIAIRLEVAPSKLLMPLAFAAHAGYLALGVEGRVHAHRSCAQRLWVVCDRYQSLLGEIEDGLLDRNSILQRRDELSAQVHAAYDQAFSLDQKAYEGARLSGDAAAADQAHADAADTDVLPSSIAEGEETIGNRPAH